MREAVKVSNDSPVLLDRFLNDAIEVDVDALCDGENVVIGGIMEHIEQAGVHSGDSACSLPPYSLSEAIQEELRRQTAAMAHGLVGRRPDERAVRDPGGPHLRARGQSARVAHRAVRVEGDRPAAREDRRPLHGRADARGAGHRRRDRPAVLLGQGSGLSVHQVSRRRHDPRSGDEVDGRGDGRRRDVRGGVPQVAARRGRQAAGARARSSSACAMPTSRASIELAKLLAGLGFTLVATRGTAAALPPPAWR